MLKDTEKPAMTAFNWHAQSTIRTWPDAAVSGQSLSQANRYENGLLFIVDTPSAVALTSLRKTMDANGGTQSGYWQCEFCVVPSHAIHAVRPRGVGSSCPLEDEIAVSNSEHYFQCMSSGTSGKPKQVRRTHESWLASFAQNALRANITSNDSYAIVGKLSHSLALYAALEAANIGADIHALSELRPDHQVQALQALASTILYATPTQLRLLAKQAVRLNISDFKLRHIFSGGGKLDKRTVDMLTRVFPDTSIQEFYGATETSFISFSDTQTPTGSVGKAYPGVQLRIENIQEQEGRTLGEIHVKSPYLFSGYVGKHEHAAQWHDGFISLGEMGFVDDNGYLFLAGRVSRRINIADQLVYPEEIESVINEHPAVHASAVIAIADEERGQVLVALVEAENDPGMEQALLLKLRQRVGSLKAPRKIISVDQLPLLASGKTDLLAATALLNDL